MFLFGFDVDGLNDFEKYRLVRICVYVGLKGKRCYVDLWNWILIIILFFVVFWLLNMIN